MWRVCNPAAPEEVYPQSQVVPATCFRVCVGIPLGAWRRVPWPRSRVSFNYQIFLLIYLLRLHCLALLDDALPCRSHTGRARPPTACLCLHCIRQRCVCGMRVCVSLNLGITSLCHLSFFFWCHFFLVCLFPCVSFGFAHLGALVGLCVYCRVPKRRARRCASQQQHRQ